MKNSVKFLVFVLTVVLAFSCSGNKNEVPADNKENKEYKDPRENSTMLRSRTDTLAVLYNVRKYLDFLKENQTDSAMAMLYEQIPDGEPVPISDSRKAEILNQLQMFPVLDYDITQMNMFSEDDCEVRYTIKYFEKEPDNPMQNTIQCIINPIRYGYYWYLTLPEKSGQFTIE